MAKQIAIIGAGATGMTACKACLEQGFDVVVFEKTNYTGGLWRYQENLDENGTASVMRSTIINSSKEMSAFSDFPPPPEFPNYMHNTKMVAYFDMYAEKFNFKKYVQFRHEVVSVVQAPDFEETGRWVVRTRNLDTNEVKDQTFDGVQVCSGHHGTVNQPKLKGEEKFKGTIYHTHSLKNAKGFEDKNVVVVGIGNSGGDAAVELSVVAKQLSHLADLLPNAPLEDFVEPNRPEEPLELADEEPFTEEPQVFDDWRNADEVEFIFGQVLFSSLDW